ncbi:pilin [Dactylosporangium sp. NPDC051484]|uniref:pilin n=1 Tax=Dactylosporangium sp. NPDC051484 TaxID=3154942 RepID=UPI00344E4DE9
MHPSAWVLYQATRLVTVLIVLAGVLAFATVLGDTAVAAAEAGSPVLLAADSIQAVVNNIRLWLVGILVAVATLFLTIGGLRYLAANGDPGETEKGKLAMKSAAIGYALALLAPLFVTIVGQWVA